MLRKSAVFDRPAAQVATVSDATYNLVIGLVLCWGFLVNWVIVREVDTAWIRSMDRGVFLAGYFGACFLGFLLYHKSKEPAISFIGYNLVVVPFGLVLNVVVSRYHPGLVLQAIQITGGVTLLMMLLGSLYPRVFQAIRTALFVALLSVVLVELFMIFVLGVTADWIDWVVAAIFCGYIGYDWGRANQIPKSIDNAVDSAAEIYMDIINLFVRILSILGRKK
jgi:FtsH-binding integral membrane protein